jgi:hypothetical protein
MAIRTTRTLLVHLLAPAVFWIGAAPDIVNAQPSKEPQDQPAPKPEVPRPGPAEPVLNADADLHLANAFGADSAELRQPIRLWNAKEKLALSLGSIEVMKGGAAHVKNLSIAFFPNGTEATPIKILRIGDARVRFDRALTEAADLARARIIAIDAIEAAPTGTPQPPSGFSPAAPGSGPGPARVDVSEKTPVAVSPQNIPVDPRLGAELRFKFNIDASAVARDLLPVPSKAAVKLPHWTNEDLARVPELAFGEPLARTLSKDKAMEATAHMLANINHVNQAKTDGFLLALLDARADLRGMPFLMGENCRTREDQAKIFALVADMVRQHLGQARRKEEDPVENVEKFWTQLAELTLINITMTDPSAKLRINRANREHLQRATVAALMQVLMPESEVFRTGLAKFLATIPHADATRALARMALFSPEDEVRAAAIEGLKTRRERDYTPVLLDGFLYPLPAVAKRAADALIRLERTDILPGLVDVLERPDPRLPLMQQRDGKQVPVVRELVRVNHHRNCVLCHAPGNTESTPEGVLKVAVPLPNEPLPRPSEGGYQSTPSPSPDIVVRIDMTYLRQDFSLMMPVADPHPWPELQRFDFLVRTRELTAAQAQEYEPCCEADEPGRLSPYHRAALYALRELTGRDTEPSAAAWRKLLKLPARTASY